MTTIKDIEDITAKDLMKSDVVTLPASAPVAEAIQTLEEYHISGAPVTDSMGRLIGVLSAYDVAKSEHLQEGHLAQIAEYYLANPLEEASEEDLWAEEEILGKHSFSPEAFDSETVQDWMNPNIISVSSRTSLHEICKVMTRESIHRVLVVDDGNLHGIISTLDVVRFLATQP